MAGSFCPACGRERLADAPFCPGCGKAFVTYDAACDAWHGAWACCVVFWIALAVAVAEFGYIWLILGQSDLGSHIIHWLNGAPVVPSVVDVVQAGTFLAVGLAKAGWDDARETWPAWPRRPVPPTSARPETS